MKPASHALAAMTILQRIKKINHLLVMSEVEWVCVKNQKIKGEFDKTI